MSRHRSVPAALPALGPRSAAAPDLGENWLADPPPIKQPTPGRHVCAWSRTAICGRPGGDALLSCACQHLEGQQTARGRKTFCQALHRDAGHQSSRRVHPVGRSQPPVEAGDPVRVAVPPGRALATKTDAVCRDAGRPLPGFHPDGDFLARHAARMTWRSLIGRPAPNKDGDRTSASRLRPPQDRGPRRRRRLGG